MIAHKIALPAVDESVDQFSFSVPLRRVTLNFVFKWLDDIWRAFCYFPDGSIREAGVFPRSVNWKGFSDYRCIFMTEYDAIDKTNIAATRFYLVEM